MRVWGNKEQQIAGFLDQGISLTGELQFSGIVRIDGNFHGSISSSDKLIIGEHAVIHADIKVGDIEVHGQIFGNLEVKRRAEVFQTGRVRGDLQTSVLVIHAGAVLDGRSRMAAEQAEHRDVRESTRLVTDVTEEKRRVDS